MIGKIKLIPLIPILNFFNNVSDNATDDNLEDNTVVETLNTGNLRQETDLSQPQ